jgi:hypothetical protein
MSNPQANHYVLVSDQVKEILNNPGFFLQSSSPHDRLKGISEIEPKQTQRLLKAMRDVADSNATKEKGDTLEHLVRYLMEKSGLFSQTYHGRNLIYCQVDHFGVFKPEVWSIFFGAYKDFRDGNRVLLGESKRYGDTLGVTYVLKFECIKYIQRLPFGVYFTRKGITGTEFKDANAAIKLLYQKANPQFSVVFTDDDWEKLSTDPISFGGILYDKVQNFLAIQEI